MIEHDDPRLHLCVVTDDLRDGTAGLVERALLAERGGATMLLLRLKHVDARVLVEVGRALVAALQIPVVVNERLDVALVCGAAGVHLSPSGMPVIASRAHVSDGFLIGFSVSGISDLEHVSFADYVTIGLVQSAGDASFGLTTFASLASACARPALAIGGIDVASVPAVRAAGARGIAVIQAVLGAPDPEVAAATFIAAFGS